ncbi:Ribosome assembly protein rrb1, partial [Coemansia erecta]
MPKRQNQSSTASLASGEKAKVAAVSSKGSADQPSKPANHGMDMDIDGDAEMGDFEDAYEDEIEEENMVERDQDSDGVEMMGDDDDDDDEEEESEETAEKTRQVYLPGDQLGEGEVLQVDNSAYHMLHNMSVHWPCLSFDFVPDSLGNGRTAFPHTMYAVAGTQAERSYQNQVLLLKWSQLHRTIHDDMEDEDKDDDINDLDEDPILETKTLRHQGGVNRVRVLQSAQSPLTATWADTGKVHIWDIKQIMESFENPGTQVPASAQQPLFTVASHGRTEGY